MVDGVPSTYQIYPSQISDGPQFDFESPDCVFCDSELALCRIGDPEGETDRLDLNFSTNILGVDLST